MANIVPALATAVPANDPSLSGTEFDITLKAACIEPLWDWFAEDTWYLQNFCPVNFQYCRTKQAKHSSKIRGRFTDSHHFNQSHCGSAKLGLSVGYTRSGAYRTWGAVSPTALAPRNGLWQHWYFTAKDGAGNWPDWTAWVESDTGGNWTALSHHVYTQ